MGYTHYWYKNKELDISKWKEFKRSILEILWTAKPIVRWESNSELPPEVSDNLVRFNGIREDGHETFYFDRVANDADLSRGRENGETKFFGFCKTATKPYDVVVVACLLAAKHHFPEIKLSSDGEHDDWIEGAELFVEAIGDFPPYPFP